MSNLKMSNGKDNLLQGQSPDAFEKVDPSMPKRDCHDIEQDQIQLLEDQIPPAGLVQHQANHFRRRLFFIAGTLALLLACGLFGLKLFGSGAGERSVRTQGATRLFDDATVQGGNNNFDDHSVNTHIDNQIVQTAVPTSAPKKFVDLACCGIVPLPLRGELFQVEYPQIMGAPDMRKLRHALMSANTVTKLFLRVDNEGAKEVAKLLLDSKRITTLNLRGSTMICDGLRALIEALLYNSVITDLNLDKSDLTCPWLPPLGPVFQRWPTITPTAFDAVHEMLKTNTGITRLSLQFCGGPFRGPDPASVVQHQALAHLIYAETKLDSSFVSDFLVRVLEAHRTLTKLNLRNTGIDDATGAALGKALEKNTGLTELHLFGNQIGDLGAEAFAKALEKNTGLTDLYLDDNQIGDLGAEAFAKALEKNTVLIRLDLSSNNICDAATAALAKKLTNTFDIRIESQRPGLCQG